MLRILIFLLSLPCVILKTCHFKSSNTKLYVGQLKSLQILFDTENIEFNKMDIDILNDDIVQAYPLLNNNSLVLKGIFLGRTNINIKVYNNKSSYTCSQLNVVVVRKMKIISKVFRGLIIIFVLLNTFLYGCKLDLLAIKQIIMKPCSIIVSLFCQLIGMPLLAYCIILLFQLNIADSMGMFLVGCSPGGGSSNMWTYLLKGDLLLSICLTFVNTLGTFASMPFWFAVLGSKIFPNFSSDQYLLPYYGLYYKNYSLLHLPVYKQNMQSPSLNAFNQLNSIYNSSNFTDPQDTKNFNLPKNHMLQIPYKRICISLLSVSIPPILGMLFRFFKPRYAIKASHVARPLTIIMMVLIVVVGIWDNLYIFKIMGSSSLGGGLKLLFASMSLPWGGFLLGSSICFLVNFVYLLVAPMFPKFGDVNKLPISDTDPPEKLYSGIKKSSQDIDPIKLNGIVRLEKLQNLEEEETSKFIEPLGQSVKKSSKKYGVPDEKNKNKIDSTLKSSDYSSETSSTSPESNASSKASVESDPTASTDPRLSKNANISEDDVIDHNKATFQLAHNHDHIARKKGNKDLVPIPFKQIIAVAIETGLQNAGLAILLLWSIYPQPEADLAITVPVACTIFTPIPLFIIYLTRVCIEFYRKRRSQLIIADPL